MAIGRNIELRVRASRDAFLDWVVSSSHVKKAAYRSLADKKRLVFCRFDDHDIVVDPADFVGRAVLERGNFDRQRTDMVCKRARELSAGRTVLEVGANIGTQTIYFLKSGVFETVVCIEPDPGNVATLQTNLLLNRLSDRVQILQVAAGEAADFLMLRRMKGNSGGATIRTDQLLEGCASEVRVEVVALDSLQGRVAFDCDDVGLIWLDTEGHEEEIFKGAKMLLAKGIPMAFEYSPMLYSAGKAERIAEIVFEAYDHVNTVNDEGFRPTNLAEMVALQGQADIFCHN